MYVFKSKNFILDELKKYGAFEIKLSNYILEVLKEYAFKKNTTNNKEIFILDIGGNIGWYPSFLGRYGYSILSFEAFEKNYYVSKKNFCYLNKDSNVVIITKGLGLKEDICHYFIQKNNAGNGMVVCNNKNILNQTNTKYKFIKESEVKITTLNAFIPYLSDKNIALIKLDVEGHELQVLEGGEELITKYHVPFIVLELSPYYLKEVGSEPLKLVKFLVENGYKISLKGFLSKTYITIEELLSRTGFQKNCFFIHNSMA
jgi:FkbM family methyltransferase